MIKERYLFLLIILLLPLISADYSDCSIYGTCGKIVTGIGGSNVTNYYNQTFINQTGTTNETDPFWSGNSSLIPYLSSNNIFNQNLTILGRLIGGSPLDIEGGVNFLLGNLTLQNGYYYLGDGRFLTNLPTISEIDPVWNANYSDFLALSAWNNTGLIQNWNVSGIIKNWQTDINLANISLYNWVVAQNYLTSFSESDPFWSANFSLYNASWSSIVNTSYYLVTNPYGFYNSTNWNNPYIYWNSTFSTFNKTYADTLYSVKAEPLWSANYTLFNLTWSSTYNSTYNAYNSTGLIQNWNASGLIKNWGSLTESDPFWSANFTAYNFSWSSIINTSYYLTINPYSFYNSTSLIELDPKWSDNFTKYNSSWSSIINLSYYLVTNPYSFYNSTTWNNPYAYWNITFATFNKTYADILYSPIGEPKAYNGSLYLSTNPSNYITNATMNKSVSCSNIFGSPDTDFCTDATGSGGSSGANVSTTTCSGTDKVSAINNNTGIVTCSADQTSAGGSVVFNVTKTAVSQNTAVLYNVSVLSLPVSANSNYTVECNLFAGAAATTTGVQLNATVTSSKRNLLIGYQHPTTIAASGFVSCNNATIGCVSASLASLVYPAVSLIHINGELQTGATANNFVIWMKSEVAGSAVTVAPGSWCRLTPFS